MVTPDNQEEYTIEEHIERLERLTSDLKAEIDGQLPPEECLQAAPLLDLYSFKNTAAVCLTGHVDRHPAFGGSDTIVTTPLWFMADDLAWVRTYSRYYRLGRPLGDAVTVN